MTIHAMSWGRRGGKQHFIDTMKAACRDAIETTGNPKSAFLAAVERGGVDKLALCADSLWHDIYERTVLELRACGTGDDVRRFTGVPGEIIRYQSPSQIRMRCAYCGTTTVFPGVPSIEAVLKCSSCGANL